MNEVALVLIVFGCVALLIGLIVLFVCWYTSIGDTPKIKLSSFLKFYSINPNRWTLMDDNVLCSRIDIKYGAIVFHFGFIDYYIYKLWRKILKCRERKRTQLQYTANMIEAVKHDIHTMECMSREEINQAKKDISNIF